MKKRPILRHVLWLIIAAWVYTLTFIFNNYWSKYASYEAVTQSFQQSVTYKEKSFNQWLKDTARIGQLANKQVTPEMLDELEGEDFNVFIYDDAPISDELLFWGTSAVLPDMNHVNDYPSGSFVKYGNGQYEFLKHHVQLADKKLTVVGLILLHQEFFIENASLRMEYPDFSGLGGKMALTASPTAYRIIGERGRTLAYFQPQVAEPIYVFNLASFIVECIASFFLFFFVTRFASALVKDRSVVAGMLFFMGAFLLLRLSITQYGIPIELGRFPLLNGDNEMESNAANGLKSLALNSFFGLWLSVFISQHAMHILRFLSGMHRRLKWLLIALFAVGMVALHFKLIVVVRNLYLNSSVAFDLANFFSLNSTTVLSFLIIFLLSATHYMFMRFMVLALLRLAGPKPWTIIILMAIAGLVFLSFFVHSQFTIALLCALLWIVLFFMAASNHRIKAAPATAGATVVWLFVYAVSLSLLLGLLDSTRLKERTYTLSANLLLQNDRASEYLVKIAYSNISKMKWDSSLTNCINDNRRCQQLKDSLKQASFSGYLNRYSTGIYLFDALGNPIYNAANDSYESLNTLFTSTAGSTAYPYISYFEESFDRFGYIIKIDIKNKNARANKGYLFAVMRSVNASNQAFAPELFRQLQDFASDLPQGFSYAWYKKGLLVEQYRNYPFPAHLPNAAIQHQSIWENKTANAYELWRNAGTDTVLCLAADRKVFTGFISMFAYVFGAFLLFYLMVASISLLWRSRFFTIHFIDQFTVNLQNKIRATVISILLVAFIIVAIITIAFFIRQFKSVNEDRLAKTIQGVSSEIKRRMPDGYETLSHEAQVKILNDLLYKITYSMNVDANCYDSSGQLITSTQNILFEKKVISPMADPKVWYNLYNKEVNRYISDEKIGQLPYTSIYQPLRNKDNQVFAYLQVPYFASQNELNQEISNFLVILINIIAFVFLLSGGLAFWISGSITDSYNIIAEKMKRIRLSEVNERIEWKRNDEIGRLVNQYNKMVDQLENSAKKMAQSEREMAWREMARQVAHEIKNPLTPMKLSLQFLQKAILEKNPNVSGITQSVAGNLVVQIDHLSNIATEFSQFANLSNTNMERFDLQQLLFALIQLYKMHENVLVNWAHMPSPIYINADKTQLNRLFTNLFQNAIEAVQPGLHSAITITESVTGNLLTIAFADNGKGIPPEIQSKIFTPNFTTKSSGTGLGLAISKAIVENANGSISFETTHSVGTTFFITLPLADR